MPIIAKGFDSATNTPKTLSIFGNSVEVKEDFTTSFNFHFSAFRSVTDFKENFKLESGAGTPMLSSSNLNAALEVSRSLALDQDVIIYVMHVCGIKKGTL